MMKKIAITLIGLVLIVIQLSITNRLRIFGVHMDLLLIFTVIMAIYLDPKTNYVTVLILGSVYDSLINTIFGLNLVALLLTTYVVKLLIDILHEEKLWSIILLFLIGTIILTTINFAGNQFFLISASYGKFAEILAKKAIINIIAGLALAFVFKPSLNHIMKNWW